MQHLANELTSAISGQASIQYGQLTRAYLICRKEFANLEVGTHISKLYGYDGDYIASARPSHVDRIFPWAQIVLTSDDLQQIPERSQSVASVQPILSSYTLSVFGTTATDKDGASSGGVSHPFGTIYFSESGARRYHHLMRVGGGLRQFSIQAALTYKDNSRKPVVVRLAPGEQFTAQLLFMRKEEPEE